MISSSRLWKAPVPMTFFPSAAQTEFTPSNSHLPHVSWLWVEDSQQSDSPSSVQSSFCSPRLFNKHWNWEKVLTAHVRVTQTSASFVTVHSHSSSVGFPSKYILARSHNVLCISQKERKYWERILLIIWIDVLSAHLNGRRNPSTVQTWTFPKVSSLSSIVFPILWNCKN